MEKLPIGYPIEVLYFVATIGLALLLYRPRWAFFFIVGCLALRHHDMAVHTRTTLLGEFLNLNDLLLWIGVLAMLRVAWSSRLWFPNILLAIFAILIAGDFQVLFQYGFEYLTIRSLWASWIFAIMFAVAANMVKDDRDAQLFAWSLFIGAVGGALHHLLFIQSEVAVALTLIGESEIRNVQFMYSGGLFLLIGCLFLNMPRILQRKFLFIVWVVGLSLVGISYILSFTRTVWLGGILAGFSLFLLLYRVQKEVLSRLLYATPFIIFMVVMFQLTSRVVMPGVDVASLLDRRADFMRYEDQFQQAYDTRQSGVDTELKLWQEGSLIWGVGSAYDPDIEEGSIADVESYGALNHVAYSSYLAHFGLIGLITYGLLLPILTIRVGRRYFLRHMNDYGSILAATAMALSFFNLFTLASGFHYLVPSVHLQGLIYGAIWGLSRTLKAKPAVMLAARIPTPQPCLISTAKP